MANSDFVRWVVDQHAGLLDHREDFLRMLKFRQSEMAQIVSSQLMDWGTQFAMESTGGAVARKRDGSLEAEILRALQDHFTDEMVAICPTCPACGNLTVPNGTGDGGRQFYKCLSCQESV